MASIASLVGSLRDSVSVSSISAHSKRRELSEDGFTSAVALSSAADVQMMRSVLVDMLNAKKGVKEGALFDTLTTGDDGQGNRSIQISRPSVYAPQLLKSRYVEAATSLAKQLLSDECFLMADYALLKPAITGSGTPWHQDEAFRDPGFTYNELTFWLPLQDVGEEDGCMFYLPGSHSQGILEHRSPGNDPRVHALEISAPFSTAQSVSCPLAAGDCTIHNGRVLHRSSDNRSHVDRYAFILIFGTPPTPLAEKAERAWLKEKRTAEDRTRAQWLRKGGYLVVLFRKARNRETYRLTMLKYLFLRCLSVLRKGKT